MSEAAPVLEATEEMADEMALEAVETEAVAAPPSPRGNDLLRHITEKEHSIRMAQQQLAEQREALADRERLASEYESIKQLLESSPREGIEALGLQLEQVQGLTNTASDPHAEMRRTMERELSVIKAKLEMREKADDDRYQSAVQSEVFSSIESYLGEQGDSAPYLSALGDRGRNLVAQRILAARERGESMSEQQAIGEAEKEIETEIWQPLLEKYLQAQDKKGSPPTITNDLAGSVAQDSGYSGIESEDEKLKRLIARTQIRR